MSFWLEYAKGKIEEAAASQKSIASKKFKEWLADAVSGGASRGHKQSKDRPLWRPSLATDPETGLATVDRNIVLADRSAAWASHWGQGSPPTCRAELFRRIGPVGGLSPITAQQLRAASKQFGRTTSARDGLHPRHFALMSDEALGILADLLNAFEVVGVLPTQMQGVLFALIDKPDGGERPIGLLQGAMRLWYKCRVASLKVWEASGGSHRFFAASSGRSALSAVWRRAFRAEAGLASDEEVLAVFTDLRKCYEHVRHLDLAVEAAMVQYPLQLLRLSLVLYSAPRRLIKDGAVGPPISPVRSIIAGSAAATFELKALMVRVLSRHCLMHPSVNISFYIDDGVEDIVGKEHAVADLISSHRNLVAALEDELMLPLAQDKVKVVGSSYAQVSSVSRAFNIVEVFDDPVRELPAGHEFIGAPIRKARTRTNAKSCRDLGVDFSVSKSHPRARRKVWHVRFNKFRRVAKHIAKLSAKHRPAAK